MSFLEHLEVFRRHIIRAVLGVLIFSVLAFVFNEIVFDQILLPPGKADFITFKVLCRWGDQIGVDALCFKEMPYHLINRKLHGQFALHINSSITVGIILGFPFVFWQIWRFVRPALYGKEAKRIRGTVFFVSLLFFLGILFGYYVIDPLAIQFLVNYEISSAFPVPNEIDISNYLSVVTKLPLVTGIMFQLPIAAHYLSKAGVIGPQMMRKYQRHAAVIILIVSGILTPPDPFTQLFVALPLYLLYVVSIRIAARNFRKRERRLALAKTDDL